MSIQNTTIDKTDRDELVDLSIRFGQGCWGVYCRSKVGFVRVFMLPNAGGLMARGMEIDKRATNRFFDYLLNDNCKGVRPVAIQKLRTKLLKDYMDKSRSANASFVAAVIIKTWNAYRQGKTIRALKFNPETVVDGVAVGETYPVMV